MATRRRWLLGAAVLLAAQLIAVPPAQAAEAPLGKTNWVVSSAGFRNDAYRNYVRLGYVVFGAGNTVEQNFWSWSQTDNPASVTSGDVYYCGQWAPGINPRNNCAVRTAPGFTGTPTSRLTGVFAYAAETGKVDITWTSSTADGTTTAVSLVEHWDVSEPRPGLARMELSDSGYSLTSGIGYGSTTGLGTGTKATMSEIRARSETFLLEGYSWHGSIEPKMVRGQKGGLTMNTWNLCDDGSCLGRVQDNAGCAPSSCCAEGSGYAACVERLTKSNRRFYYMSGAFGGRRNTYEYWCECLSYNECYTRNSHIKPMLQVIDDDGGFHGWVGVEVSPDRTAPRDPAGEFYSSWELIA
jgi:hypothetical protein